MNKKLFILPILLYFSLKGSEKEQQRIFVSKKCYDAIVTINKDGGNMYPLCSAIFALLAINPDFLPVKTPSQALTHVWSGSDAVLFNNIAGCKVMSASNYVLNIIVPRVGKQLDAEFKTKLAELKQDRKKAWAWLDEEFLEKGINQPLFDYKKDLVRADTFEPLTQYQVSWKIDQDETEK